MLHINSSSKNFTGFFLTIGILGVFVFHWFLLGNMMPASDCLSSDACVYSSAQTIPSETTNILLVALIMILLAGAMPSAITFADKFKKIPGKMFLEWKTNGFCRKLIFWLRILEKKDAEAAFVAVRFDT